MAIGVNRRIIFIDGSVLDYAINVRTRRNYDRHEDYFEICYLRTGCEETIYKYLMDHTIIFYRNCCGEILVYSSMYQAGTNLRAFKIKPHIEASFDIFKDATRTTDDPIWMIQFLLDDPELSDGVKKYLNDIFYTFTDSLMQTVYANRIFANYHPDYLRMCFKKHLAKAAKNKPVDPTDFWPDILTDEGKARYYKMDIMGGRGNGKTKLAREMMLNYIKYGDITPPRDYAKEAYAMEKMVNFRKKLEYIKRDKKHPCEFNIKFKDSCLIYKIVFQGATRKELFSAELIENVLIIAAQMMEDMVTKVIFNLKNKMTIIFPLAYGLPEKVIVKANGADSFDILKGYSIAKAKMMCSEDGYEWLNKLKNSGKVDA